MLPKGLVVKVIALTWLLQNVPSCFGQSEASLNITRRDDGDIFTRVIVNASNTDCKRWSAENVSAFSKKGCAVRCKCGVKNKTYHLKMKGCFSDEDILNFENCGRPFIPRSRQPLCYLSRQAQMELRFPNQSYCFVLEISYFNGTNDIHFAGNSSGFNISEVVNGSARLTWNPEDSLILSELPSGPLLKVRILCSGMTSPHYSRSCLIIKTRGEIVKKIDLTPSERRQFHSNCLYKGPKNATNVMLVYIIVGSACGLILVVFLIACFACYSRRRKPTRQATPRLSTQRSALGARKPFKTRSATKTNEPTTPAIHDIIFNELSWDGDGGFSNRALADPRISDVDYGIPVDFGSLPRPDSSVSIDSNRNSLAALTGVGEHGHRRT